MLKLTALRVVAALVRAYLTWFPWDKGKWKLWTLVHPYLGQNSFEPGTYWSKGRFKLYLDPSLYNNRFIYYWGLWEPDETRIIESLLRKGDVFLDVGANIGYFTLAASVAVGETGHVFSIEPVPPTAARLKENIALNGLRNVTVYENAAIESSRPVKIAKHGFADRSGQHSMRFTHKDQPFWDVAGIAIDQLPMNKKVTFIKMDIEGAEMLALEGLRQTLEGDRAPTILCEVTDLYLAELGSSAGDLYRYLKELGYHYAYDCHGARLTPYAREANSANGFQRNIVFSKTPLTS